MKIIVTEKFLDSELWFGKDDEGVAFISVISGERPKIKFEFNISDYHKIHRSGNPITKAEASCLQALAVVRLYVEYLLSITVSSVKCQLVRTNLRRHQLLKRE